MLKLCLHSKKYTVQLEDVQDAVLTLTTNVKDLREYLTLVGKILRTYSNLFQQRRNDD